jgi:DUF971 family protein
MTLAPTAIEIEREDSLTLTWPDETTSRFELVELRVNCPCAECRGLRETQRAVWPTASSPPRLAIVDAELVGAWGISLRWNDNHATGIYPWDLLREWREPPED